MLSAFRRAVRPDAEGRAQPSPAIRVFRSVWLSLALHGSALALLWLALSSIASSRDALVVELVPMAATTSVAASETHLEPTALLPLADAPALGKQVESLKEENRELLAQLDAERRHASAAESERETTVAALAADLESAATERAELRAQVTEERQRAAELEQALESERLARLAAVAESTATYDRLVAALRDQIAERDVALRHATEGITVSIANRVLFPSGQATLTPEGARVLDGVAAALAEVREQRILIEGHTDSMPIGPDLRSRFASNWELSTARATEVVKRLIRGGKVAADRLLAAGRADTEPAASNDTEEGRQKNRRIEIILFPLSGPASAGGQG